MKILEKIKTDLKEAMKSGEKTRLSVLRMLISSLNYKKIEKRSELEESDVLAVLRSEEKERLEAIEAYEKSNRLDRTVAEKEELAIIRGYLPAQFDEGKIKAVVEAVILETQALGMADFGKVMKKVMGKVEGQADGAKVASIVKERLSSVYDFSGN